MVSFHTDIKSYLIEVNSTSGTQHTMSHIQFPAEFLLFLAVVYTPVCVLTVSLILILAGTIL